jgi:predicted SnoaL-like aldol condensation-catalyzing enzyme
MTSAETVMHRWFDEVWNQRRDSAIDELMTPDAVAHGLGPEPVVGTAALKPFVRGFIGAFPDLQIRVVRCFSRDDLAAVHIHCTGTHTGDGLAGPPTERAVVFEGMVMARIRDGRIVEGWNCIDFLTMYQHLGWVSNPVQPS